MHWSPGVSWLISGSDLGVLPGEGIRFRRRICRRHYTRLRSWTTELKPDIINRAGKYHTAEFSIPTEAVKNTVISVKSSVMAFLESSVVASVMTERYGPKFGPLADPGKWYGIVHDVLA